MVYVTYACEQDSPRKQFNRLILRGMDPQMIPLQFERYRIIIIIIIINLFQ